jgi:hypothetical protein
MKATTIRFGATVHEIIEAAAKAEGVSFSQYVREASILRAVHERTQRQESIFDRDEIVELLRQSRIDDQD